MITDYLKHYQEEFQETYNTLRREINNIQTSDPSYILSRRADLEGLLSALRESLQNMEAEASSSPLKASICEYSNNYDSIKKDVQKLLADARRRTLIGTSHNQELDPQSVEHRTRLANATQQLKHSTSYIVEARKLAAETENIGDEALQNLVQQRSVLQRGIDRTKQITAEVPQPFSASYTAAKSIPCNPKCHKETGDHVKNHYLCCYHCRCHSCYTIVLFLGYQMIHHFFL